MSSHIDSRASSPRASPYRNAAAERASSVASGGRARRTRPEPYQLEALKKLFHRTATPSIEERGALALEINMDVGKVTNWFRNLRQTTRKRNKRLSDDGDEEDDNVSLATYTANSRDVSRAGSPLLSGSSASFQEAGDVIMSDPIDARYSEESNMRPQYDGKPHRVYSHLAHSRSHSDVGSDDEYQEAVTPSPESSPAPPSIVPATHSSKRAHAAQSPSSISLTVDALSYAEMEKATAKYHTGVKVEDALLLLSFHHNVVR